MAGRARRDGLSALGNVAPLICQREVSSVCALRKTYQIEDHPGALARVLSAALFAMALLGFVSAPLARVAESHHGVVDAGQEAGQVGAAQLSSDSAPRRLAPSQAAEPLLEDFEVEERGDDDGEHDHKPLPSSPIVITAEPAHRSSATPARADGVRVPFRRRAFSSRAPPSAA